MRTHCDGLALTKENTTMTKDEAYRRKLDEFRELHLNQVMRACAVLDPLDVMGTTMGATVAVGEKHYSRQFAIDYVCDIGAELEKADESSGPFTPPPIVC
jgi:hypothetical protein